MSASTSDRRWYPGRVRLTLTALRIGIRAQAIKRHPLEPTLAAVLQLPAAPGQTDPNQCMAAAALAARLLSRAGLLGNCIVRALIGAALLSRRNHVRLHIGFRDGAGTAPLEGHAWITLDGKPLMENDADTYTISNTFNITQRHDTATDR